MTRLESGRGFPRVPPAAKLAISRIAVSLLLLGLVSMLIFAATQALPGDVVQVLLGKDATRAQIDAIRAQLNLDKPVWQQYLLWAGSALRGDLGVSFVSGVPVSDILISRFGNTVVIVVLSFLVSVPLALTLGILSSLRRDGLVDRTLMLVGIGLNALPEFVLALFLVLFLSTHVLHLLPAVSLLTPGVSAWLQMPKLILPVLTLALLQVSYLYRLVRAAMIDVLASDYIEFAHLKGIPPRQILLRHALPNAVIPFVQATGTIFAISFGGVVVIEYVFAFPGLGTALASAVGSRDIQVVQAVTLTIAAIFFATNIVTDLFTLRLTPPGRGGGQ